MRVIAAVVAALIALTLANENLEPNCPRMWTHAHADKWGASCPKWAKCSGNQQSPVDIVTPMRMGTPKDLEINYKNTTINLFNTGRAIKFPVNIQEGHTFCLNGETFYLRLIEFHSPSEHRVNGRSFDLEMQLIHDSFTKSASHAVISVFFNLGAHNCFLDNFFFDLPEFDDCMCGNNRLEPWKGPGRMDIPAEECDNGPHNNNTADRCRTNCKLPTCGDGITDSCEQCDMGKQNNNQIADRCRENCVLPTCGDGVVDNGEECDDGNRHNLDGCSSICRFECGDGFVNTRTNPATGRPYEECDRGDGNSATEVDGCRPVTCLNAACGDGVVDTGETCDNGAANNNTLPDACRTNCRVASCGDGVVDLALGETCDHGPADANTGNPGNCDRAAPGCGCSATCRTECGNGVVDFGETCDDGSGNSNNPNATCRTNCQSRRCGDGIVDLEQGEECDRGPADRFCDANCRILCGNGRIDPGEECDNNGDNTNSSQKCRQNCFWARCGDGIVDFGLGEQCDAGDALNSDMGNAPCRSNCMLPKCGDNFVDSIQGEECDDGNRVAEDGCDPECRSECGNNKIGVNEECDDGDMNDNVKDSCRKNCRLPRCGDGITDTGEQCDDGANNGNSPNSCRADCRLPYCGDNVVDDKMPFDEHCDNGMMNSDVDPSDNACAMDCRTNRCRRSLLTKKVNPWDALPKSNVSALCYEGSLTSPPCTENVKWVVFEAPETLSELQFLQFRSVLKPNNRPLQPLNGRRPQFCNDIAVPPHAFCGNGWKDEGEECDHGVRNSDFQSDACRTNCRLPRCGDNIVDVMMGEECDNWNDMHCDSNCKMMVRKVNPFVTAPWSYKRAGEWGMHWPMCAVDAMGNHQAPINVVRNHVKDYGMANPDALKDAIKYDNKVPVSIFNTGNLPIWNAANSGNNFVWNGTTFALSTVEFHMPAEHMIEGHHADFEIQFHHMSAGGKHAVISVLYKIGTMRNRFLDKFLFYLPQFLWKKCGNGRVEDDEQCDDGHMNNDFRPNHCRTNCKIPHCGDGIVDRGEQCDDGFWNSDRANACRPQKLNTQGQVISKGCMWPRCGDGIVDAGEECDDGNNLNGDGCTKKCKNECGDGMVNSANNPATGRPFEECDNGPMNSGVMADACRKDCRAAHCGDGVVDAGEACDLGITKNSNTTSNRCRINCALPRCGDGVTDWAFGEECDDGINNHDTLGNCTSTCKKNCGNKVIDTLILSDPNDPASLATPEECDDGECWNRNQNSMCRTNCRLPTCGDGILDTGAHGTNNYAEKCDDGAMNFEFCCSGSPTDASCTCPNARCSGCQIRCGNGITEPGEECDAGTANDDKAPNCCRTDCKRARCGDGVRDDDEECDMGASNANMTDKCRPTTCVLPKCGDGIMDSGEECDAGTNNGVAGSGCTKTCRKLCGNGMKDEGEECDNGMMNSDTVADACRTTCKLPTCGDGVVDHGEQCDTAALLSNAANACRPGCKLPTCGDGVTDTMYGEHCDNGNTNNNDLLVDGCSTTCQMNKYRQCNVPSVSIDLDDAFPTLTSKMGIYHYMGSMNKPPCTAGTQYVVYQQMQHMSLDQAEHFRMKTHMMHSSRGTQSHVGVDVRYPTVLNNCGNCVREGPEECDDGERNSNSHSGACRTTCMRAKCGDGIVDYTMGEQCDGQAGCNSFCKWITSCPVSASGCPGACSGNRVHCPSGSCGNQPAMPANSTIININFANMLSKSTCTTCSR